MNPSSARASAAPTPPSREAARSCRRDEPQASCGGDEFERLLRSKTAARNEKRETDDPAAVPACESAPTGVPAPAAPLPRPLATACAVAAAGERSEPTLPAARAVADAAMNAPAPTGALGASANDAASAWSVSLNQPLGLVLEMRATRAAGATGSQASWTLTIASPAHDAAQLARHAPRLNERLRARALTHTHVRIESNDEGST